MSLDNIKELLTTHDYKYKIGIKNDKFLSHPRAGCFIVVGNKDDNNNECVAFFGFDPSDVNSYIQKIKETDIRKSVYIFYRSDLEETVAFMKKLGSLFPNSNHSHTESMSAVCPLCRS